MKEKKIPTLVGLFILTIGLIVGMFLVQNRQFFKLAASPQETPQEIKITNISDSSFTVSWFTSEKTTGFVSYGKTSSGGQIAKDDLDTKPSETARFTHHVTITNLNAESEYFFSLGSNGKIFNDANKPWRVKTAPDIASLPPSDIISGKVESADGKPVSGAIVYLTIPGISPLSTVTSKSGNWSFTISTARGSDLSSFASYSNTTPVSILVLADQNQTASAQTTIAFARPVPVIVLGGTYDFRGKTSITEEGTSPTSNIEIINQQASQSSRFNLEDNLISTNSAIPQKVEIKNISDGEIISTTKPQFIGNGPPGIKIGISVQSSTVYSGTVTVDTKGNWSWTLPSNLSEGRHTISLSWIDQNGVKQILTRSFVVQANSQIPSFTASPSGQLQPTPTSTPTPTLMPTATPSPTPKPSPTSALKPTSTTSPTPTPPIPVSGNSVFTLAFLILGSLLLFIGLAII